MPRAQFWIAALTENRQPVGAGVERERNGMYYGTPAPAPIEPRQRPQVSFLVSRRVPYGSGFYVPAHAVFTWPEKRWRRYNQDMARGWESKSVEAQIQEADFEPSTNQEEMFSAAQRQATLKRRDLLLSRKRILQQLAGSGSERYSELLRRTLASLDAQIADLS
jgi:hypothetical protein